ncbi:MAG: lysophospholipid acyltransferase family protein [Verrucomicrobiota bacterium JB025]|nr:lysophospholipid acyltransferase family protein [Verrucomicrobiota bacterium JB025]
MKAGRQQVVMPEVVQWFVSAFTTYGEFCLRRKFHSVRVAREGMAMDIGKRPVVFYVNHASWWDPLVCLSLAGQFFPGRKSYAPIDPQMFERYAFFRYLGFFPAGAGSPAAALRFVERCKLILHDGDRALWITPQGGFRDVRERPVAFMKGLGAVAAAGVPAVFVPLAIEYVFWSESKPEVLVSFGDAVDGGAGVEGTVRSDPAAWTEEFEGRMSRTQDRLAELVCRRDPDDWEVLLAGARGTHAPYDLWRWLRARLRGERYVRDHQETVKTPES